MSCPDKSRERSDHVVHIRTVNGHRLGYQTLFSQLFGMSRSTGRIGIKKFLELLSAKYVLFATMDGEYLQVLLLAALRSLLSRPTSALFIRPQTCFTSDTRSRLKRLIFGVARRIPSFRLLTIVPFSVRPEYENVANGWIYDPELWDLSQCVRSSLPSTDLSNEVELISEGRPVLSFIGNVNAAKGFPYLCRLIEDEPDFTNHITVVVAGRVSDNQKRAAQRLLELGVHLIDRYLEDDEVLSLYGISSAVWCAYDPSYDQASGVFGRAVQTNCVPIVRKNSLLFDMCLEIKVQSLPISSKGARLTTEVLRATSMSCVVEKSDFIESARKQAIQNLALPEDKKYKVA